MAGALLVLQAIIVFLGGYAWTATGGNLSEFLWGTVFALIPLGFVLFCSYLVLRGREDVWRSQTHERWHREQTEFLADQSRRIAAMDVRCEECHNKVFPIANSEDKYRCTRCEHVFVGSHHGIIDSSEWTRLNPDPSDRPYPLSP